MTELLFQGQNFVLKDGEDHIFFIIFCYKQTHFLTKHLRAFMEILGFLDSNLRNTRLSCAI